MARKDERSRLLALYRTMVLIRQAEEKLGALFADGEVPGFIHLSIGQEAVPTGIASVLSSQDHVASNHRGHGHALAKGLEAADLFREVMGRRNGVCRGRGGSMHVADFSVGMLGANGIVGAGIPVAAGSALALRRRGGGAVAVVFFGDGALAEGVLHETLNLAALWQLPLLFVCENNGWAEFSRGEDQIAFEPLKLAGAFGIAAQRVDGNDVEAVAKAAAEVVGRMRKGAGPAFLECVTMRVRGHFEGDPQRYRGEDVGASAPANDPIVRFRDRHGGKLGRSLDDIDHEVAETIAEAVALTRKDEEPDFADARHSVYA